MENLKRQIKRITSIILIITILVGVLPNFGLLKVSKATAEELNRGIVIKKGNYDEANKVIALEVYIRNINLVSFDFTFSYPSEILTPISYQIYELMPTLASSANATNIGSAIKINTDKNIGLDTNNSSELNVAEGTIRTFIFEKDYSYVDSTNADTKMYTIYFRIEGDNSIDSITADMFPLIYNENVVDPSLKGFNIVEYGETENIVVYDPSVYKIEGFKELPSLQLLAVTTNPTEGQKYIHGNTIDLTGTELTATYSDDSTQTIAIDDSNLKITTGEQAGAIADINNPTITFEYKGKTTTLDVTVIDPVIEIEVIDRDKILINGLDSGESIPKNEEGLYLQTTSASGNTNQVSLNDTRVSLSNDKVNINEVPADKRKSIGGGTFAGVQTITVTYKENDTEEALTTTLDILVNDKVASIEISTTNPPTKEFTINDTFTKSGAIVLIGLSGYNYGEVPMSSDSVKVTELDGTPVDLSNTTSRNLLVSFGEATETYPITIENRVKSIQVNQDEVIKLKYDTKINAQQAAFAGITVTEIMEDGTAGATKDLDFSWIQDTDRCDANTNIHTLKIKYPCNGEGEFAEGEVQVQLKNEVTGITVEGFENKNFVYNDSMNYNGVTLIIQRVSGSDNYIEDDILGLLDCNLADYGCELEVTGFDSTAIGPQTLTFTYSEEGSNTVSTDVEINIGKATLEVPACEVIEIYEGKKLSTVADQLPTTEYGQVEWKNGDQVLTYSEEEQEVDATYKMNDTYSPFYEDVDCKIKVKVLQNLVASIEVLDSSTNKKDYVEGQNFNPIGMQIKVTYESGDVAEVTVTETTTGITYTPSENLQVGNDTITVAYGGKEATQTITVDEKVVTEIRVTTPPTKTTYVEGQSFDKAGMVVTAYYNDDTNAETNQYEISPNGNLTLDDNEITITYTGEDIKEGEAVPTATADITVEAKVVTEIKITTQPAKTEYIEGQTFDPTGMKVTAYYNDDTNAETNQYEISPNGNLTQADRKITITYKGIDVADLSKKPTASVDIKVEAKVVTEIKVTTPPTNTEYIEGHPFDKTGMIVTAYYNDGTNAPTQEYEISPNGNLGKNDTTITITYTGADVEDLSNKPTTTVDITIIPREVASIAITKEPDKTSYYEGQAFNPAGMEITVTYNDGENPLVIKDDYTSVTFSPSLTDALETSNNQITVTYDGHTATQAITVEEDYVTEITVTYPNNFQQVGKNVDLSNTTIQKKWASELSHGADDTEAVTIDMISSDSIADGKFTASGTVTITVTYDNGKTDKPTATFTANVEDTIQSITLNNIETSYYIGDEIDSNIEIAVNYSNPANNKTINMSSPDWKNCVIKGIDMSKPGTYTLTVEYGGCTTEGKTITVKDYVKEIRVVNNKLIYKLNEDGTFNIQVNKYMASEPEKAILVSADSYNLSHANVNTSATGTSEVTVTYSGTDKKPTETITDKFSVQVINATAKAILDTTPTKMPEKWGDELNLAGASIKVQKQDGTYSTITLPNDAVTVSAYNSNTLANQTISFTYKYKELNEMNVEVEKVIPVEGVLDITLRDYWTGEIRINGVPTTSIRGQELNLTNATISKVMATGALSETTPILNSMISNFDKNVEGKQTVTVTHFGKSATFDVTVTDYIVSVSMNKLPNKVDYIQGEAVDVTGAVLNVIKQSGRIEEIAITKEMISGYNPNKVGQQTVVVNYFGFTTTFVVNVKAKTTDKPTNPTKPTRPTNPTKPSDDTPVIDDPTPPEEIKKYLVTFVNYDGTIIKTEEVESGKSATAPKVKTRKGYKFIGWDKDFDVVEEDMTVTAEYEKITTVKESPKPTQTLGEKDEVKEDNKITENLIPATIGLAITGLLLLLISILTKKNVEVYAIYEGDKKLIGKEKISKNNNKILLDSYKSKLENATAIELRIDEKVVEKMEDEIVEVVIDGKTKKYKMTDIIVIKK